MHVLHSLRGFVMTENFSYTGHIDNLINITKKVNPPHSAKHVYLWAASLFHPVFNSNKIFKTKTSLNANDITF